MADKRRRSLVKAISFRVIALLTTIIVSYAILGDWTESLVIGVVANGIKMFLYYGHERLWEKIKWGLKH